MSENSGSRSDLTGTAISADHNDVITQSADSDDVIMRSAEYEEVMTRARGGHFVTNTNLEEKENKTKSNKLREVSEAILECLHRDILACDVQLSLFVGAASSYRHDSSLSPFPPLYLDTAGNKDIKGLQETIAGFPSLAELKNSLEKKKSNLSLKQLSLLRWVFEGGQSKLTLRTIKQGSYLETLKSTGIQLKPNHGLPNFILEVSKKDTERWLKRCESEETFHGFHGSRLDNWFSILHNGLQQHRSKTSKFGEGIYLSSDIVLSLNYSTRGIGWEKSLLGPSLSCLTINQVINHENVKIHSDCPVRGYVKDSEGGSIPEHHILVRDNQLVHARYLMVYCGNKSADGRVQNKNINRFTQWLGSNKMLVILLCYGILLAIIGLSSSHWARRYIAKLLN